MDTHKLRIRAPVPCTPTLHYFTVRAPDSFSLKDEHATNSWSVLRIHAVFLLLLQLIFFFLTNYYSHPEVWILYSKSHSIPFATAQNQPKLWSSHLSDLKSRLHFLSQSLDFHSHLFHRSHLRRSDLHSRSFKGCCWFGNWSTICAGKNEKDGADKDKKQIRAMKKKGKKMATSKKRRRKKKKMVPARRRRKKERKKRKRKKWNEWSQIIPKI